MTNEPMTNDQMRQLGFGQWDLVIGLGEERWRNVGEGKEQLAVCVRMSPMDKHIFMPRSTIQSSP